MYADLAEITLLSEPGQSYEYSNFGMGWLGRNRLLKPLLWLPLPCLLPPAIAILSNYGDAAKDDLSVDEMEITILMELASQ